MSSVSTSSVPGSPQSLALPSGACLAQPKLAQEFFGEHRSENRHIDSKVNLSVGWKSGEIVYYNLGYIDGETRHG